MCMTNLINGRTPEEIKKGLYCCNQVGKGYSECPYDGSCMEHPPEVDALALIEHLEAQQPKWISVKDRLPDVQESVLFCHMIGKDVRSVRTGYRSAFTPGRFYTTSGMGTDTVTHWMQMPQLPEEGAR